MYINGQTPNNGQPETSDIFRELVEATPQLPIDKLVTFTKSKLGHLKEIATQSNKAEDCIVNPSIDRHQEART